MRSTQLKGQQSGFTLIELVVVIVILGILAATALPRFADMSTDARIAKMKAAQAALQTAVSLTHAQWLVAGSPTDTDGTKTDSANSLVVMEGTKIAVHNGYPDVGGDGDLAPNAAVSAPNSGILLAAGGLADYDTTTTAATTTVLTIQPDASRTACKITYTESAAANTPPVIDGSALTAANCK